MHQEIIGLCMNFETAKNDMKYRCENLQLNVDNMEEIKQGETNKYMELLAGKDAEIAEMNRKLLFLEKQQLIKDKTDLLSKLRNNAEEQEITTLNQRITDLLNVIQASNKEINDLRTRLRHSHDKPTLFCDHE